MLKKCSNINQKTPQKLWKIDGGFLDSKDYNGLYNLAEALNKKGYTVVQFDPAGTWESEGDISEYTVTQYLEDIKNILEYMLRQSAYKEILLGGHSIACYSFYPAPFKR